MTGASHYLCAYERLVAQPRDHEFDFHEMRILESYSQDGLSGESLVRQNCYHVTK